MRSSHNLADDRSMPSNTATQLCAPPRGQGALVLVVDDNDDTRELVRMTLDVEGHRVTCASSLTQARSHLESARFDLVVAELQLADGTAFELLDEVEETPVVIVSATDSTEHRLRAFRMGADDYVTKPFVPAELAARVRAVRRRCSNQRDDVLNFDDLRIDLRSRRVTLGDSEVDLTAMEFDLLAFLASNPGRVYTRHQLLTAVWHTSSEWQQEATVTEHVRRVRLKLRAAGHEWLQTVRSVGYRFDRAPQTRIAPSKMPGIGSLDDHRRMTTA